MPFVFSLHCFVFVCAALCRVVAARFALATPLSEAARRDTDLWLKSVREPPLTADAPALRIEAPLEFLQKA
jgi:hypothetical protein